MDGFTGLPWFVIGVPFWIFSYVTSCFGLLGWELRVRSGSTESYAPNYLSAEYKSIASCDKNIFLLTPCESALESATSEVHEVMCNSLAAVVLTEMLAVLTIGKKSVEFCLTTALASCVGSGTSDGTICSTFIVEAGPSGTKCDEEYFI